MEKCNNNKGRKRVRDDDSEADSSESKILRVDSESSDVNSGESGADSDGYERVNEIQEDLLNMLDDADNVMERDPTMQGLDSVIKSFEEEILAPGPDSVDPNLEPGFGEFERNLGYLLEATDDELGLPPQATAEVAEVAPTSEGGRSVSKDSGRVGRAGVDLTGFYGFEDDIWSYEGFGFGNGGVLVDYEVGDSGGGCVTLGDGLFDYVEPVDVLWRSESLQAM